jgi:hypothetical protein
MKPCARAILPILFLALLVTGCGAKTPAQQLATLNGGVTLALNAASDARDAGVIKQADLDQSKPFVLAYREAERKAEVQIRAAATQPSKASDAENAVAQVKAALVPLAPLLDKLGAFVNGEGK